MADKPGLFESLLPGALTAGAGVSMASDITKSGADMNDQLQAMADQARAESAFTGYGVKTGLADSTVAADGSINLGVGGGDWGRPDYQTGQGTMANASNMMGGGMAGLPDAQQTALGASEGMMGRSMQDNAAREQEIYSRMMAAQQPGMDRARAGMESRAFAQGRGGISGSQYGGSGEQFAQSRAEAEARNSAMLGAMNQSQQEMMNQGALASQYGNLAQGYSGLQGSLGSQMGQLGNMQAGQGLQGYQASFMPMQNQLQAMQMGATNADMAQTGQLTGANLGSQLDLGGAQIDLNSQKAASELYGNMFGAMTTPLAGLGGMMDDAGAGQWVTNKLKDIFNT